MTLALILSAIAMTLIVGVRYLLASGAFALATKARHPNLYAGLDPQIRREIWWSLASAAIYGVPAGIVAWGWQNRGWTQIYADIHAWPLWYWPLSVFLYLFAHDSWFYWTHRLMHHPRVFRVAHAVHHASRPPTAWAAMSFHPWEALTGAVVMLTLTLSTLGLPLLWMLVVYIGSLALLVVSALHRLEPVTQKPGREFTLDNLAAAFDVTDSDVRSTLWVLALGPNPIAVTR